MAQQGSQRSTHPWSRRSGSALLRQLNYYYFFLKSCCSLNIYRSVGDGDNNNNRRKGVLTADVLLSLSDSEDAERDAAPPPLFQLKLLKQEVFRRRLMGCTRAAPPHPPTPGESFALSTKQLQAPAARPCPSASIHARPRLHSHFKNIIHLRVSGCLICALAGERGHTYSRGQRVLPCRLQADAHTVCAQAGARALPRTPQPWMFRDVLLRRLKIK